MNMYFVVFFLFQKLTVLVGNPIDLSCVDNDSLKSAVSLWSIL